MANGQQYNASLKLSPSGIKRFFSPISKDFLRTGLVPSTVRGLTE